MTSQPHWKELEYYSWVQMKTRCLNPRDKAYARYGGRGIKVCARWQKSYVDFVADVGRRPTPEHSLDRIDNNGNYEPGNCRWATSKEQCRNRRSNIVLEFNGQKRTIAEWAEFTGLSRECIWHRLNKHGWTVEQTLTITAAEGAALRHLRKRKSNGTFLPKD